MNLIIFEMQTYTVVSWLVVIGGIALYVYYISPKQPNTTDRNARAQLAPEQAPGSSNRKRLDKQARKKADKPIQQVLEQPSKHVEAVATGAATARSTTKKRKAGKSQPAQDITPTQTPAPVREETPEVDADKDWVARLQANKEGVSFKSASKSQGENGKSKNKKNRKLQNGVAGDAQTAEEFYAGTDAEMTSSGPSISEYLPSATDVSDMLEPTQAGPSSLRITGEEKPKKVHTPKPVEPQETKKQRQNRRKVEEKKILREEAERERQALLEKQRRSAREARGEPAKNGFIATAPSSNAWTAPIQQTQAVTSTEVPLFDTFEQDGLSTASSNEMNTNSTTPATNASIYGQDLPSEETQMQMLGELTGNSGWNEVSKSRKTKKKAQESPSMEAAGKENGIVPTPSAGLLNGSAKTPNTNANTNMKKTSVVNGFSLLDDTSASGRIQSHPDDSEWTVA